MRTVESARRDWAACRGLILVHGSVGEAMSHCTKVIDANPNNFECNRAWSDRLDRLRYTKIEGQL